MGTENTRELIETRLKEACVELGKMEPHDPKRKEVLAEIDTLNKSLMSYDQTENDRLATNAKNDLDQQRINVEIEKVRNDGRKIKLGWGQVIIGVLAGLGINTWSYLMAEYAQPDKPMQKFGEKMYEFMKPKDIR